MNLYVFFVLVWVVQPLFGARPATDEVIALFEQFGPIPRASGNEEGMRSYIRRLVLQANAKEAGAILEEDAAGNMLVRIPGNGVLSEANGIALHAHLDMVEASELPGAFAATPFSLVRSDGWIHAQKFERNLGLDNGLGVAMALRFLTNLSVPHPPLELLFTVSEESTMAGAASLEFSLRSNLLIDLDAEEAGSVCRGCQGASLIKVVGSLKNDVGEFSPTERFRISLSGLPGGHSGLQIHENRLNAAKAAGEFLDNLRLNLPEARVINVRAGKREEEVVATGTIPAFLEIDVALESRFSFKLDRISRVAVFDALGLDHPVGPNRRTAPDFKLNIESLGVTQSSGMSKTAQASLAKLLKQMPDGFLGFNSDFPNGVETSSNVVYFKIIDSGNGTSALEMLLHNRSFSKAALGEAHNTKVDLLKKAFSGLDGGASIDIQELGPTAVWMTSSSSSVVERALRIGRLSKSKVIAGTLEMVFLTGKYPSMEMISIGPTIEEVHTPRERANIASLDETIAALDRLLLGVTSNDTETPRTCADVLAQSGKRKL